MPSQERNSEELAKLYRAYWALILPDACKHLDIPPTMDNKRRLHESHKKIFGCESIAGESYDFVSEFVYSTVAWYAVELGIFLRTSGAMPEDINDLPLSSCWEWL
jgi:hypothetical protein